MFQREEIIASPQSAAMSSVQPITAEVVYIADAALDETARSKTGTDF